MEQLSDIDRRSKKNKAKPSGSWRGPGMVFMTLSMILVAQVIMNLGPLKDAHIFDKVVDNIVDFNFDLPSIASFYDDNNKNAIDYNKRNVRIVVSRCDKPIDWIWRSFADQKNRKKQPQYNSTAELEYILKSVSIIAKCSHSPVSLHELPMAESSIVFDGAEPDVHVVSLPNVGRCDHTYAYWNKEVLLGTTGGSISSEDEENEAKVLYSNHKHDGNPFRAIADSIDPTDLIVFTKDNENDHKGSNLTLLDLLDILTAQEQPSSPVATTYSSLKQSNFSKPVTRGIACQTPIFKTISPKFPYELWQHVTTYMVVRPKLWRLEKSHYERLERDFGQRDGFKSQYRPMGKCIQHFPQTAFSSDYFEQVVKGLVERDGVGFERNNTNDAFEPDLSPICYGGIFATYWGQVASDDAPLTLEGWKAVTKSLSRGDSIEEGHYMERWWADILTWSLWAKQTTAFRSMPHPSWLEEKPDSSRGITLPKEEQKLLMSVEKTHNVTRPYYYAGNLILDNEKITQSIG